MLRYLRENTGNWLIKIFLGIIVVVFVFLGIGSMNSSKNDVVATVDGEPISIKQFQIAHENMMEQLRQQFGENLNEDLVKALNVKKQALDTLINQQLVQMQAEKLGIIVSDQELSQSLMKVPAFQKNGQFDMDRYKKLLQFNSMTPAEFEDMQRNAIREEKLSAMITDTVVVSDLEARQWYIHANSQMAVDYLLIEPKEFSVARPSDAKIEQYYKDHGKDYQSQVQRKAVYLEFSPADYLGNSSVTKEQVAAFYAENKARFQVPEKVEARHILIKASEDVDDDAAKAKAMEVYKKAVAGTDFAALAQKFSQGPSAANGGYLGSFARGEMVKPFEESAFSLAPGKISKPVKTNFGWHVIQVIAKHKAVSRTLDQAAGEITQELSLQQARNLAYDVAGKAFDSVIDGDDMEQAALIAKKKVQYTPAFDQTGKGLTMPMAQSFASKAFLLPFDTISDVIQLADRYYIIRVTEEIEPVALPLEQVKAKIIAKMESGEQENMARQTAEQILEKVKTGVSLAQAGKEKGISLTSTELFSRKEPVPNVGGSRELTEAAFSLSKSSPLCDKIMETTKGFVIMQFKNRKEPSQKEMDDRMDGIRAQLIQIQRRQYYQQWMKSLREKASIQVEKRFFN